MRIFLALLFFTFFCLTISAQYSPSDKLLTIDKQEVTAAEFERIFNKNYNIQPAAQQSIQDYFDMFLKFKLKVCAAVDARLDTATTFKQEFRNYRDQLARNYLTDSATTNQLIHEAYERTINEANVSHIMVRIPVNPTPADTLAAYQKIMKIRERLNAGEPFDKLATEVSDDPSAKTNHGNLGYFGAFHFPYSFETAAFTTKTGEISTPVRTTFGFHLIKVEARRPSPGEIKVAHIMLAVPQDAPESEWKYNKSRIDSLYQRIKNGEDFGQLAENYSDDQNSAKQKGELQWFGSGVMVPEFENVAFQLKTPGQISQPVRSAAGWHILKLIDKRGIPTFDQAKASLKAKLQNNDRVAIITQTFISKLKKEYSPKSYPQNLNPFFAADSSIYKGKINISKAALALPLLTIEKENLTGENFKQYLEANPTSGSRFPVKDYIELSFKNFIDFALYNFENSRLETKYPDFGSLMKEYYEGLLLFDIMEKQIWSKASRDTSKLQEYYNNVWVKGKNNPKKLDELKGSITADYQEYLEEKWLEELKNKYKVVINRELLHKIADKYKNTH